MAPNLRLLRGALADTARGANAMRLRELCDRDFEEAWNRLKAIAGYGDSENVRLQALELMLAYCVGRPTAKVEMQAIAPAPPAFDLGQLTGEELRAYRLLAQARDRMLNGGNSEVIEHSPLPPLPPLK